MSRTTTVRRSPTMRMPKPAPQGEDPGTTAWPYYDPFKMFKVGLIALLGVTVASTLILWGLGRYYGQESWTLFDCLFMVVITLSTVGYGDWLDVRPFFMAKAYTLFLNVVGVVVQAFFISNVTAVIVEGIFSDIFRRRRMKKRIAELKDHIIVCGVGTLGVHCVEELLRTGRPFVAIDRDGARLHKLNEDLGPFLYLEAEADEDSVLKEAGIATAKGLIACLTEDKDNLFVTLSARRLNPKLRVVSKSIEENAGPKITSAGAAKTVNPTAIGGMRLVSELVRPAVVTFLDAMMRDPQQHYRFEELVVEPGCAVSGKTLGEADLRCAGDVLALAVRKANEDRFTYNPKADYRLEDGSVLVVLGQMSELTDLRSRFGAPK